MNRQVPYTVVIEKGKRNYGAYVPDLPGCVAVGDTVAEVTRLIREAIAFHIEGMLEEGQKPPRPSTKIVIVKAKIPA